MSWSSKSPDPLSNPAFQMNFILTLVDFHFYFDASSHVSCSPDMVHRGHLSTPTRPAPPHCPRQLKFIPQPGCAVIHLVPFWWAIISSFFAITSNAVLNGLLLASLHICWEFLSRINLKPSGLCIFTFNRHCQITQREGCAIFPSYRQLVKVPVQPSQALGNL